MVAVVVIFNGIVDDVKAVIEVTPSGTSRGQIRGLSSGSSSLGGYGCRSSGASRCGDGSGGR